MADERYRELERRWKESGTEEDAEAVLQEKVRGEGWSVRMILELALGHALGHSPRASEILEWWASGGRLPCVTPGCTKHAMIVNEHEGTGHDHPGYDRRICVECWEAGHGRGGGEALIHAGNDPGFAPGGPITIQSVNLRLERIYDTVPLHPPPPLCCHNDDCRAVLPDGHTAVYCNACARADA